MSKGQYQRGLYLPVRQLFVRTNGEAHRRVHARSRHRVLGGYRPGLRCVLAVVGSSPITRSPYGLCSGARGALTTSLISKARNASRKCGPVDSVAITVQISRRLVPRKGLADLLPRPGSVGRSVTLACTTRRRLCDLMSMRGLPVRRTGSRKTGEPRGHPYTSCITTSFASTRRSASDACDGGWTRRPCRAIDEIVALLR
jgi:hypothetical protein